MVFQPLGTPLAIPGMDFEWKAEFWEWALPALHTPRILRFSKLLEFPHYFQDRFWEFGWESEFWEWALPELHALGIPGFLIFLEFSQKFQG